jgi:hypothetical protein
VSSPTPFSVPVHEYPEVVDALARLWTKGKAGVDPTEYSFLVRAKRHSHRFSLPLPAVRGLRHDCDGG